MKQRKVVLALTLRDAATMLDILTPGKLDEPGTLTPRAIETADRIAGRSRKLL